jgi:CHAT domain-containing protein/tetratricopeptide (TPR) repeat protein
MKTKNSRLTILVAVLFAISVVMIASQASLVTHASAQNASGYQVDSSSGNGLYATIFKTPHGEIKVNFPDEIAAGDMISGSIFTEPIGKDAVERAANSVELNGYLVELLGQKVAVENRKFSGKIPERPTLETQTIALWYRGKRVASSSFPVSAIAPSSPTRFSVPTGGQQGRFIQIKGPSNGVSSPQDSLKIGEKIMPLLAESPRSLVVWNTSEALGLTNIALRENGVSTECPFRNVGIKLAAPKLNLIRGERTTLHVVVLGLTGLTGGQTLDLDNTSPTVISMAGGDKQHINISPAEVKSDGTYSLDRTLTGIMAGGFGLTATVKWTDVCNPVSDPIAQATPSGSPVGQRPAKAALDQGRTLLSHFKFYAAVGPLSEALKSYNRDGNQNGIGVSSDALGDLYQQEGQYALALRYFVDARKAFIANKETLNANLTLSKIGETYLLLDDNAGAKAAFAQFGPAPSDPANATDIEQHKAFFAYARNKLGEGRADYLLGQLNPAEADFKELLASASLQQNANFKEATRFRVAAATNLGDVLFRKGQLTAARDRYNDAIQLAGRDRRADLEWAAKAGLGRTLWQLSKRTQTARLRAGSVSYAAHASSQTPEIIARLQKDALDAYREALANIETVLEGSVRAHEARTTFLSTTSQVFDEAAAVNAEMALAAKGTDPAPAAGASLQFAAEGFRIAEAGRARSLLDVLADGHAEISAGVPAELIKRRSENLASQQLISTQLMGVSIAGEVPKQGVTELEAELERLALEFESLENQIKTSSPRYTALVHTRSLTLGEVQQQILDDGTALLEYTLGDENSYLWVVTPGNVSVFKLPAGSIINQLAMDFRAQLIPPALQKRNVGIDVASADEQRGLGLSSEPPAPNTAGFVRAASALYKVAVAPAAPLIGGRRLVVVADGALNFVPFEALVTSDRGSDYSSLDYLVKTNRVSYAPSASVTAAMRDQKRTTGRNILLVADPIFSANDPRLQTASANGNQAESTRGLGLDSAVIDITGAPATGDNPLKLSRLAGTRAEAEQIARLAKTAGAQADMWLDLSANEAEVKTHEIQSYRVLHVATHGILDAQRPQFSGLVLSLVGNKNDDDGFLRTSEVFNLKLGAPLVMLSACESGLGKLKRGEGVIGLTRAFMYAGAPTVGVTLWSVADKPTAQLMTDFYQQLLGPNPSPSSAMREAQLVMISGKKYSAPFYWAPFVLVGEWK